MRTFDVPNDTIFHAKGLKSYLLPKRHRFNTMIFFLNAGRLLKKYGCI
jgi:hypothetical protein